MAVQQEIGRIGENLAAEYLQEKGYTIFERNWRSRRREIDMIVYKDGQLVFVEVKCRSPRSWIEPWQAVGVAKQKRLISAAHSYVLQKSLTWEVRFDVISVVLRDPVWIEHIENAFYPSVN